MFTSVTRRAIGSSNCRRLLSTSRSLFQGESPITKPKQAPNNAPNPTPRPIYPPASNPFSHAPSQAASESNMAVDKGGPSGAQVTGESQSVSHAQSEAANSKVSTKPQQQHSELKITIVKTLARLMGYHSKSVTAIRETSRMCGGIVNAVSRDHAYWYTTCGLPPTYQTFFQLHLLYLLITITRLRALPNSSNMLPGSTTTTSQTYQTELLTHFFALAENQMRLTLGQGEKERVVRKYMGEMGQQWKGAGISFDYALARGQKDLPVEPEVDSNGNERLEVNIPQDGADAELAGWVWRNLLNAKGAPGPYQPPSSTSSTSNSTEEHMQDSDLEPLEMAIRLEEITDFIRREVARLENIPDKEIMNGDVGQFGLVREQ